MPERYHYADQLADPWEEADLLADNFNQQGGLSESQQRLQRSINDAIDATLRESLDQTEPSEQSAALDRAQAAYENAADAMAMLGGNFDYQKGANAIAPYAGDSELTKHANCEAFPARALNWLQCCGLDPANEDRHTEPNLDQRVVADILAMSQEQTIERAAQDLTAPARAALALTTKAAAEHAAYNEPLSDLPRTVDPEGYSTVYSAFAEFTSQIELNLHHNKTPELKNNQDALDQATFNLNWPTPPSYNNEQILAAMIKAGKQAAMEVVNHLQKQLNVNGTLTAEEKTATAEIAAMAPKPRHDWAHYRDATEKPWQENLCHYSPQPINWEGLQQGQSTQEYRDSKPNGFWVSVTGYADWPQMDSELGLDRNMNNHHEVHLSTDANLLVLENTKSLDALIKNYGQEAQSKTAREMGILEINWEKVAQEYDGVVVLCYPYPNKYRHIKALQWDANSGVIWNQRAIESVEHTDR